MGDQEFRDGFGNGQFPQHTILAGAAEGDPESQRVLIHQNSAYNVFMMGSGNATINLGFHPGAVAQRPMAPQAWNNVGLATPPQPPQQEQFQPSHSFGATGTTIPQSGSIEELRNSRLSAGATIHPSKLGTKRFVSTFSLEPQTYSAFPPITRSLPNGNSPQDLLRKSPESGYGSPSPADIIPASP